MNNESNDLNSCLDCRKCPVFRESVFQDFNKELIEHLNKEKTTRQYKKADFIFNQGKRVEGLFCHSVGLVKINQIDKNGNTRFTRLVLPSDTSGHRSLFVQEIYKGTAQVVSETATVCFVPTEMISFFLSKNVSFAKNLIARISRELHNAEENHIAKKEKTVRGRLAELLCQLARTYADEIGPNQFMLKSEITKKEIAQLLLAADETVIRIMSEMQKDNLITYVGRRLLITDFSSMEKAAKH